MVSSRVAARAVCAAVGFLLLAGSARAQFEECPIPAEVPTTVYTTIASNADLDFGGLSQSVCDGIVKRGVAMCKVHVKGAAKCGQRSAAAIFDMLMKQCAQVADPLDRAACKESARTFRAFYVGGYASSRDDGLAICDTDFPVWVNAACMDLPL